MRKHKHERMMLVADRDAARERLALRLHITDDVFGHAIATEDWVRAARAARRPLAKERRQ